MKLKIGILKTDSVLAQYQDPFGDYPQMFEALLLHGDKTIKYQTYDVTVGEYPNNIDDCDGYIITGSKASVYDTEKWIEQLKHYIIQIHAQGKKLVAICFGHQLVAEALGGKTIKSAKGWGVGVQTMQVVKPMPWMKPAQNTINLIVSHEDQVTQLPTNATILAGNNFCENSITQIKTTILTIQGHPEFSKPYAKTMMQHRAGKLGNTVLAAGLASLALPVDDQLLAKWIVAFLQDK